MRKQTLRYTKTTGPKPTKKLLDKASTLAKANTASQIAVAMTLRPNGATQNEIVSLLGHPHRNKIKQLIETNQVKKHVLPEGSRATRIKLIVQK